MNGQQTFFTSNKIIRILLVKYQEGTEFTVLFNNSSEWSCHETCVQKKDDAKTYCRAHFTEEKQHWYRDTRQAYPYSHTKREN